MKFTQGMLAFFLLLFLPFSAAAFGPPDTVGIREALSKNLISYRAQCNYKDGRLMQMQVVSKTSAELFLRIEPGNIFICEDAGAQNQVITEEQFVKISPSVRLTDLNLYSMCIESGDYSPSKGIGFKLGKPAEPQLMKLVKEIAQGNFQNSTAQSAVWSVTNGSSINEIFGSDTNMVRRLSGIAAESTGESVPVYIAPRPHFIIYARKTIKMVLPEQKQLKLVLCDAEGKELRTYFDYKNYQAGLLGFTVGLNRVVENPDISYKLRLVDRAGRIVGEETINKESADAPFRLKYLSSNILFDAEKAFPGSDVRVYDESGKIYMSLREAWNVKKGNHRFNFRIPFSAEDSAAVFTVRAMAGKQILVEKKIFADSARQAEIDRSESPGEEGEGKLRQIQARFYYQLNEASENLSLGIFDAEGKEVRNLFRNRKSRPTILNYSPVLKHRQGPEAKFFFRLTDGDRLIKEQPFGPEK